EQRDPAGAGAAARAALGGAGGDHGRLADPARGRPGDPRPWGRLHHGGQREPAAAPRRYRHPVRFPPAPGERRLSSETREQGHGRVEWRRLVASTALVGYLDWPGAQQVFRVRCRVIACRTGVVHEEVTYGITSLAPGRADAARLLRGRRAHWGIENRSHWVRDVTFGEDRSRVRVCSIPEVLAALRNATIGLLRASV